MKQQVVYIHGGQAFSEYQAFLDHLKTREIREFSGNEIVKRWPSTLVEGLGEDFEVFSPSMPNSQNAKYEEWKIWFERYFEYLYDGVILVGWSQGGYFLVKYLIENQMPMRIKALLLVAAPFEPADFGGEDGGDFAFATDQVGELSEKVSNISILHSKDDFVVPYDHALKYAASLPAATFMSFEDKNHFLIEEFPELLKIIKTL